jgi:hypothetical protein
MHWLRSLTLIGLLLLPTAGAHAQDPADCPDDNPRMDDARYLRALSLDLRGDLPSGDELALIAEDPEQIEVFIDQWLASEEFVDRAVRLHGSLLWPNISNVNLINASARLFRSNANASYWNRQRSTIYRGGQEGCLDEPLEVIDGVIQTTYDPVTETHREGYVWVAPYYAPQTPVKVCGFDAQTAEVSPTGTQCDTRDGFGDVDCGCGPNLNYCQVGNNALSEVLRSFGTDVEMRIARVIREDLSYLDLFTSREAYVNGPLVHYWKNQTEVHAGVRLKPLPVPAEQLPDLEFSDGDTWHSIQLGEEHAGVLTSPLFLLRFQTGRARATRFSTAFLCQPYSPPEVGIDVGVEENALIQDLQDRPGCEACHTLLEPDAAYWGRWTEAGAGYLAPEAFPSESDECYECATTGALCSDDCNRYYVVSPLSDESEEFLGMLKAYEFREEAHMSNPELGPKRLVTSAVAEASGRLPACVSRTAASYLLGRELDEEQSLWVEDLSRKFVGSGFSYRALIREIVTSPVYRSLR